MIDTSLAHNRGQSGNPHISELINARVSRRSVLGGTVAVAATGFLGGQLLAPGKARAEGGACGAGLGFAEVAPSTEDDFLVPPGYAWDVLIPWGTPLLPGAAAFAEDASNTAADQAKQIGFNHDGMHYFPLPTTIAIRKLDGGKIGS